MYNQELTTEQVKARQERAKLEKESILPLILKIKEQLEIISQNLDLLSDAECDELFEDLKKSIML